MWLLGVSDAPWVGAPLLIGAVGAPYLLCFAGRDGMPPETLARGALQIGPRAIAEAWR